MSAKTLPEVPRPRYERAKKTASTYSIGVSTLWQWVANRPGFPQPLKAGPKVTLFDLNAIDAYLQSQQVQ